MGPWLRAQGGTGGCWGKGTPQQAQPPLTAALSTAIASITEAGALLLPELPVEAPHAAPHCQRSRELGCAGQPALKPCHFPQHHTEQPSHAHAPCTKQANAGAALTMHTLTNIAHKCTAPVTHMRALQ